jgi:hypothetical protein
VTTIWMNYKIDLRPVLVAALFCCVTGCGQKAPPKAKNYAQEESVGIIFTKSINAFGLSQRHLSGDGANTFAKIGGQECQRMNLKPDDDRCFLYFKVDPTFKTAKSMNLQATIEYFDATPCAFSIEYDSWDRKAKKEGAYAPSKEKIRLIGDQKWKTVQFTLKDARLEGRQNSGADFRLRSEGAEFFVRSVFIYRE